MKILFCVTHLGLLRHYATVLQQLVDRGHSVHVVCEEHDRGLGVDADIQQVTGGVTGVTFGHVPAREKTPWTAWSYWLHMLMDWVRYFDPAFASADALRNRVAGQIRPWTAATVRVIRRVDPTGHRLLRVLRALDRVTPPSRVIQAFIAQAKPNIVMVSPYVYVGFEQADHVKAAQALGIRTAVCVASWDNLTNKGLISTIPDRVFVWNEAMRAEAITLHAVPPDHVVATGAQLFDRWFDRQPSRSREEFCRVVGLDPGRPYILYTGSSDFIAPREGAFVRNWVRLVRRCSDPAVAGAGILIRPHPKNYAQFIALDLDDATNVTAWPLGAKTFDATFDEDLFDSLYHSRMVVGINASAQIEAAIVGRSVRTWRAPDFVHSQDGTLHFQYLAADDGGLVRVAESADEHLGHLSEVMSGPEGIDERTRRFVESFVRPKGLAIPATRVFADAIEGMAAIHPAPQHVPAWGWAARIFIYPFGALVKPRRRRRTDMPQQRPLWLRPVPIVVSVCVHVADVFFRLRGAVYAIPAGLEQARRRIRRGLRTVVSEVPKIRRQSIRRLRNGQLEAVKAMRRGSRTFVRSIPDFRKQYLRANRQVTRGIGTATNRASRSGRRAAMRSRYLVGTQLRRVVQVARGGVRACRRGLAKSRYLAGTLLRKTRLRRSVPKDSKPPVETM